MARNLWMSAPMSRERWRTSSRLWNKGSLTRRRSSSRPPQVLPQRVDLARVLDKVRERVQPDVDAKGLTLRLDVRAEPLTVSASPGDVERLVGNLLENAVKYTPSGGSVTVTLAREGDEARMDFADTGIGIAPDALPHVFDEFYRAGNAKQQSEGTGLGLTLVRRIVDLLHGTISVESTLAQGTTFTMRLPLADINPDNSTPR